MKKYFPFLIIVFFFSFYSCTDDDDGGFTWTPLIDHRGVYINDFNTAGILGNTTLENELLAWCDVNDFNKIYLYNIGAIVSNPTKSAQLNSFMLKAANESPAIDVTFVSAGHGTSFGNIEQYHDDYSNEPEGIVSEIEFWNGSGSYTDGFAPWIERLNLLKLGDGTVKHTRNPGVIRRFYIGKIKDAEGILTPLEVAKQLVLNHDEILLTNYHTDAFNLSTSEETNSIKNKMRLLAQAGLELDKEVNLVILFNVRQDSPSPHIWNYFDETDGDNEFENSYISFSTQVGNAVDIPNKEYLILKGYGIYRYSNAILARP